MSDPENPIDGREPSAFVVLPPSPRRRFEMHDGDLRHFWEIEVTGNTHRVRYGTCHVGAQHYATHAETLEALAVRVAEKIGKGFAEVRDELDALEG